MKVFTRPTGLFSRAMTRVADALERYAPSGVEFTGVPEKADVRVLHVIDFVKDKPDFDYIVIQYCGYPLRFNPAWQELWRNAKLIWSYYPLKDALHGNVPFYRAPLGLDAAFVNARPTASRDLRIVSSGYTTGSHAEAIEEVAVAVGELNLSMMHLGPSIIENMVEYPPCFRVTMDITDEQLAELYRRAHYVSGLRHIEGFEMPVIEGLACGARPIVFDRPDMRRWYNDNAVFVPECVGRELIEHLKPILASYPRPVTEDERLGVLDTFNWERIARGFWNLLDLS